MTPSVRHRPRRPLVCDLQRSMTCELQGSVAHDLATLDVVGGVATTVGKTSGCFRVQRVAVSRRASDPAFGGRLPRSIQDRYGASPPGRLARIVSVSSPFSQSRGESSKESGADLLRVVQPPAAPAWRELFDFP